MNETSASDRVFWAGYSKGKKDALEGVKSTPTPPDDIDHRWGIDWRIGYAEGYHDGGIERAVKA